MFSVNGFFQNVAPSSVEFPREQYSNGNIHSIQSSLDKDLLNINRSFIANKLTLSMTKAEFVSIDPRQKLNSLLSLPFFNVNTVPIKHFLSMKKKKAHNFL